MPSRAVRILAASLALHACARIVPTDEPCTHTIEEQRLTLNHVANLDVLFMVDNSSSMGTEQASLAAELPRLVSVLASGDFDQDGDSFEDGELNDVDFLPVDSLHVGVITSDMGSGGHDVPTCAEPHFGDDGILRSESVQPGCSATYPPFVRFDPLTPGELPSVFAADVACVAVAGTGGCGFEQPLEAMLKALSPTAPATWAAEGYLAPTFHRGTLGHGDRLNDGFVREGSVLAIIPLTDEGDCSALDPELFAPDGPYAATDLNLRCSEHPEALHPIERYVDGYLQLRQDPRRLIFAPIAGVPVDLTAPAGRSPDWNLLTCEDPASCDPRMLQVIDPASPGRLVPSCNTPGVGIAFPPTRLVRVARALEAAGAGVTVQSICQESYGNALDEIVLRVSSRFEVDCLARPSELLPDGSIDCAMLALMPEGLACEDAPGGGPHLDESGPVVEEGRALCELPQILPDERSIDAPPPTEPGWYYDDFSARARGACGGRRIAFTTRPPPGSQLRFRCRVPVTPETIDPMCE